MNALAYTRFELLRTLRNRRFFILSLGFPLVLYFLIAGPQRHNHSLGGTGVSAPLYFMVGMVSFGTMSGMLSAALASPPSAPSAGTVSCGSARSPRAPICAPRSSPRT